MPSFHSAANAASCTTWATGPPRNTPSASRRLTIRCSKTKARRPIPARTRARPLHRPPPRRKKMNAKTDARPAADDGSPSQPPENKPYFALFVATAGGLGYFPKAPGTFGSLAGLFLAAGGMWLSAALAVLYGVLTHDDT